jgi:hypothetical protein
VAAVILLLWRVPQTVTAPRFWAEDGAIFFKEARLDGLASLVAPYAGYLHAVPRLVAWLWSCGSAVDAPAVYAGASVAVAAWSAATVGAARMPFAWLFGVALLCPPHSGEAFGTLTNVQWVMAPALALCIATPAPAGRWARLNQLAFCAASALSGPFSLFAAPLAAWRLWRDRIDRHALALGAIVLAAAALQAWFLAREPSSGQGTGDPAGLAWTLLDRSLGQLATGHRLRNWRDLAFAALVATAAAAALARPEMRRLLGFVALELALTGLRFLHAPADTFDGIENADRYFLVPRVILLWAVLATLVSGRPRRVVLGAAALALILVHDRQWQRPPRPVLPWAVPAAALDRGEAARIPVAPLGPDGTAPWALDLPARTPAP